VTSGTTVFILNGPNLNMLGVRQPEIYGSETLEKINSACIAHAGSLGISVDFRQSNAEGELIAWVHEAMANAAGVIINPGALTHTSIGLYDALTMVQAPIVEVHLSNIYRREDFRHHSYVSKAATGSICGFGAKGYLLAIDAVAAEIDKRERNK